jgi:hypothetical protein
VLFVNFVVIVCLFISQRLDDKESKENGPRSPPRNGEGDPSIKDEDEDYFEFAKPGKPSFHSYSQMPSFNIAFYLF